MTAQTLPPRRHWLIQAAGLALTTLAGDAMTQTQAARMRTRPIPSTGEALPVIGLGTYQALDVGDAASEQAPLEAVLQALVQAGGSVVDSSPMYGRAESVAGALTERLGLRSRLFLATKVWTSGRDAGIRQMEESFRRMRAGRMDLMQVHNLVDWRTHLDTLKAWKAAGRVRYLGITHYHAGAYGDLERVLKQHPWDFLQLNYSLAEREAEERLLPLAAERGVAVIANRPFAQGALFSKVRGKPLPAWAADIDCTDWAQFFLKWIVGHPAITCAIPATAKVSHMTSNIGAGLGRLPDAAMRARMADFLDSL